MNEKKKTTGQLQFGEVDFKPIFTFLDYIVHRTLNIVPIVAIDFSLANLTFDNHKCIHSLKRGQPNDYRDVMGAICNAYRNIASYMVGFGFGAKIVPKTGRTSNCFAMNGNFFDPVVTDYPQLYKAYSESLQKVEISLPVNYESIFNIACDYAEYEKQNHEARNYFVLIVVSAGVIDDFDASYEAVSRAADLPLSVLMVKVGNVQLEDVNDPAEMITRSEELFEECERRYVDIVSFEDFKEGGASAAFELELIKRIPDQVQKYMEKNSVFAYDLTAQDYVSRKSVAIKERKLEERKGTEEVKEEESEEADEGEEGWKAGMFADNERCLSFSNLLQERFMAALQEHDNVNEGSTLKKDAEEVIARGVLSEAEIDTL